MRKVFLVFAVVFVSNLFTSCTDLYEESENESLKLENKISRTGGEDGHVIIGEQDPTQ
jgi:hypothetical protein